MRVLLGSLIGLVCSASLAHGAPVTFDVVVYGGTSGGVIAAVQAGRMGKSVVLIEPGKHLGGMTSGGLGATDIGNPKSIGGVSREFYGRILHYYEQPETWKFETREAYIKRARHYVLPDVQFGFEPHVAEQIYNDMVKEAHVNVVLNERLDLKSGVVKEGSRILSIKTESGQTYAGKEFIDATYEGDLMAKAAVAYTVGREANAQYHETINGIQTHLAKTHQFKAPIDPYVKPGDPTSGLLPNIHEGAPGEEGAADSRQQAYNYRLCTTDAADILVPFPKPDGYDPLQYELLLRQYDAGLKDIPWGPGAMPNRKTDTNNNGAFSTDYIGMNNAYPDADYAMRDKIIADHIRYDKGLLWTLANDPRVPEKVREKMNKWGLAKDEFVDNGNWPYQLYVREARRMIGVYVMTQDDTELRHKVADPIGLGSYGMDSHNCQRYIDKAGHARNEGDVEVRVPTPYGISYQSLTPKAEQCSNLLVPVCMSATHMAYGSIRMEPVYMVMGQAAGTAAALSIDDKVDVQKLPYDKLRDRLVADHAILIWTGPIGAPSSPTVNSADLPGIVVNDSQAVFTGEWAHGSFKAGVDGDYQHDLNEEKGKKSARFEFKVPTDGRYEVRFAYVAAANRATNVPVIIETGPTVERAVVNERIAPPIDGLFVSLGTFSFSANRPAAVIISNADTNGHVVVNAVQLLPAK